MTWNVCFPGWCLKNMFYFSMGRNILKLLKVIFCLIPWLLLLEHSYLCSWQHDEGWGNWCAYKERGEQPYLTASIIFLGQDIELHVQQWMCWWGVQVSRVLHNWSCACTKQTNRKWDKLYRKHPLEKMVGLALVGLGFHSEPDFVLVFNCLLL